jgi:hypothetical protein
MIREFDIARIKYRERAYDGGSIRISEDIGEAEIFYKKKSLFSEKMISLVKFNYYSKTELQVQGRKIFLNDVVIETDDERTTKIIEELIRKPHNDAVKLVEQKLRQMETSIRSFLVLRAKTFDLLSNFKTKPREVTLQLSSMDPGEIVDPVEHIFKTCSERLAQAFGEMRTEMSRLSDVVGVETLQKLYALTYAMGVAQNAILLGDGPCEMEALSFISREFSDTPFLPKDLESLTMEEVTGRLLDANFKAIKTMSMKGIF